MATELNMPQMGYDMQEGTLVRWLKAVGDEVSLGDPVAEIETDKAVVEFESTAEGVLLEFLVEEGTTVAVGEVIAMVGAEGEDVDGKDAAAGDDAADPVAVEPEDAPEPDGAPETDDSAEAPAQPMEREEPPQTAIPLPAASNNIRVSPVARRLAVEQGIDLRGIEGTGPGGRILRADVIAAAEAATLAQPPEAEEIEQPTEDVEVAPPAEAVDEPDDVDAMPETDDADAMPDTDDVEAMPDTDDADAMPETDDADDVADTDDAEAVPETDDADDVAVTLDVEVRAEPDDADTMAEPDDADDVADTDDAEAVPDTDDVEVRAEPDDAEAVADTDVAEAAEPAEEPEPVAALPEGLTPLSRMRQQIARVTTTSKTTIPHFYVTTDIDMTHAMALRKQINDTLEGDVRVSVNDLVIKACVDALKRHPNLNSTFTDDGILTHESINIGIAISAGDGLIMPAILDCGGKSLAQISAASQDLAQRSQSGTLQSDEYTGGTFSISNMGMFDVTSFVAIIQPPQSAVLAVGTVQERAVVQGGEIVVREMMSATLSVDHRVSDGVEGAQFIADVKQQLERPLRLLL